MGFLPNFTLAHLSDIATIAAAVFVAASAVFAYALYRATQKTVAKREALSFIRDQIGDEDWLNDDNNWDIIRQTFLAAKTPDSLSRFMGQLQTLEYPKEIMSVDQQIAVRRLIGRRLNRYEVIAIGIRQGAIDAKVYQLWWGSSYARELVEHRFFIQSARSQNFRRYKEFHTLGYEFADEESREKIKTILDIPYPLNPQQMRFTQSSYRIFRRWRIVIPLLALVATALFGYWLGLNSISSVARNTNGANIEESHYKKQTDQH